MGQSRWQGIRQLAESPQPHLSSEIERHFGNKLGPPIANTTAGLPRILNRGACHSN
jgi:hypothetical protein